MSSQLFYRVYSPKSAGGLVCGKANQGPSRPSYINADLEFANHKHIDNREPTALVSVTSSIIRALNLAFNKHYRDGEKAVGIRIAFIEVPDGDTGVYHSAQEMAERCHERIPVLFKNEFLFEWEIPMEYVVHTVSVQTLFDRGLNLEEYREKKCIESLQDGRGILPPTSDLREKIAYTVFKVNFNCTLQFCSGYDMFECQAQLAGMVRAFGARTLNLNLAWEIFVDCCTSGFWVPRHFQQRYNAVFEGCNEFLLDWWLLDDKFNYDYESHLEYAVRLRKIMTAEWDDYVDNGFDIYADHTRYDEELEMLMDIEVDAVRIGL
ncbi:hypothetical protein EAE96_004269 [Botrytis aclada]|nr:hypothetical protein EAE96_004269 [Botrytis aclada]